MPYCSKCGTKLDEDAKYCHVCGTAVGTPSVGTPPPQPRPSRPPPMRGWTLARTLAVVLGSILIVGVIAGFSFYLPVRPVSLTQTESVPSGLGVNSANLDLSADVATFNITFGDLSGTVMTLNVTANGRGGFLAPSIPVNVTVDHSLSGNTIFVDARVARAGSWWPWLGGIDVVCDVHVDRSLNLTLKVKTSVGRVVMVAPQGVVFDSLDLETTTGQAEVSLERGVIVNDAVLVQSTTGGSSFLWDNAKVTADVSVGVKTTTGGVHVSVTQDNAMRGNVTLDAETVTGGVDLAMTIHGGVGTVITSSTSFGGVSTNMTGFSGTKSPWQSTNYPAPSNFVVVLKTTTGGISIDATYRSDGHV